MSPRARGLVVGVVQVALVASLGATLAIDRATYPRVWVRAHVSTPSEPLRGRYLALYVEVAAGPGLSVSPPGADDDSTRARGGSAERSGLARRGPSVPAALVVDRGQLLAVPALGRQVRVLAVDRAGRRTTELASPLAYYIPEPPPDGANAGEDRSVWVEVTVPPRGLPRPLAISWTDPPAGRAPGSH